MSSEYERRGRKEYYVRHRFQLFTNTDCVWAPYAIFQMMAPRQLTYILVSKLHFYSRIQWDCYRDSGIRANVLGQSISRPFLAGDRYSYADDTWIGQSTSSCTESARATYDRWGTTVLSPLTSHTHTHTHLRRIIQFRMRLLTIV